MSPERPLPAPDPLTEPYWSAAREHRFLLPRCKDCGRHHFYPRSVCPHCASTNLEWVACSGKGTVHSFTVVHRAPSPAFADETPYIVAIIALEEGPHLMSNVVNCAIDAIQVGMAVRVAFRKLDEIVALPVFEPHVRQ